VLAVRQSNQWTQDAPLGANAPVQLRGYTVGEYLGKSMSSIEVEERHRFAERWTATVFGGVACLYGGDRSGCSTSDLFPSVGAGVQYVLKPEQASSPTSSSRRGRMATGPCSSRWDTPGRRSPQRRQGFPFLASSCWCRPRLARGRGRRIRRA
jgi:hypothetical protein